MIPRVSSCFGRMTLYTVVLLEESPADCDVSPRLLAREGEGAVLTCWWMKDKSQKSAPCPSRVRGVIYRFRDLVPPVSLLFR